MGIDIDNGCQINRAVEDADISDITTVGLTGTINNDFVFDEMEVDVMAVSAIGDNCLHTFNFGLNTHLTHEKQEPLAIYFEIVTV